MLSTMKRGWHLRNGQSNSFWHPSPAWQRTPANNAGYDLFRSDQRGETIYCEVKAMTRTLDDRPVGISRTQFEHAYKHGESFWLYIVEHAGSSGDARIVRIQDPAGNARTFTYDSGWRAISTPNTVSRSDDDKRGLITVMPATSWLRIVRGLFAQPSAQAVSELLCLKSGGLNIIRQGVQIEVEDLVLH